MANDSTQQTAYTATDDEFKALEKIVKALSPLDEHARRRILDYAVSRFIPGSAGVVVNLLTTDPRPRMDMASGLGAKVVG